MIGERISGFADGGTTDFTAESREFVAARRDRRLQTFLAQARGPIRNGDLLRSTIDRMLLIRESQRPEGERRDVQDALVTTLTETVEALEAAGIHYAITGSIASSVHGEPVTSLDVDLLVQGEPSQAAVAAVKLGPRFYAPPDMLESAARELGFVNVIDNLTSFKVDLSFAPREGFLAGVMKRRVRHRIGGSGPEFWFVTPEDVILMKLLWRKDTLSSKQWENALSVARVRGARMDWGYLFGQSRLLGLEGDLVRLRDEAGI